jgi:hydroxymethylpyrimidine pyrophosphatase-like HAD family hydrolase
MTHYSTFFFDIDGTLAESRQRITSKIAKKIAKLSINNNVAIISGASLDQILDKVVSRIKNSNNKNIYLLPTSGASLFVHRNDDWHEIYNFGIKESEVKKIKDVIKKGFKKNQEDWKIDKNNREKRKWESDLFLALFKQNCLLYNLRPATVRRQTRQRREPTGFVYWACARSPL